MPSLIDAIKKQKQIIASGGKTEFKDQGSIELDVNEAIASANADTLSRIANHIPYYFSEAEEAKLLKKLSAYLKEIKLSPTKNSEIKDLKRLIEKGRQDVCDLVKLEVLIEKQKEGNILTESENQLLFSSPDFPSIYLEVHEESKSKLQEFYVELIKLISLQVLVRDSEKNEYVLHPDLITEMGLHPLLAKLDQKGTRDLRINIILSIANNLIIPLLGKFKLKLADSRDWDLRMRFDVVTKAINDMVMNSTFSHREVEQVLGASLPVEYVLTYIEYCRHNDVLRNKILTDPFYGNEIRELDTAKQRSKVVTFFVPTQKKHEKGDQIFQYVSIHYPNFANQIYNDALYYKSDGRMNNQFVYAIKALVRLGKPELAYQAVYEVEPNNVPSDPEKLHKAVKERAIKAHMKFDRKSLKEEMNQQRGSRMSKR